MISKDAKAKALAYNTVDHTDEKQGKPQPTVKTKQLVNTTPIRNKSIPIRKNKTVPDDSISTENKSASSRNSKFISRYDFM